MVIRNPYVRSASVRRYDILRNPYRRVLRTRVINNPYQFNSPIEYFTRDEMLGRLTESYLCLRRNTLSPRTLLLIRRHLVILNDLNGSHIQLSPRLHSMCIILARDTVRYLNF